MGMKFLSILVLVLFLVGCSSQEISQAELQNSPVSQEFVELGAQYDYVSLPLSIGGKLAYEAQKGTVNGKNFIIFDGKEYGEQYEGIQNPVEIGGKLAFRAVKSGQWYVVFNGEELGGQYALIGIDNLVDIEGKPGYTALLTREGPSVFVWGGKEYGKGYERYRCRFRIDEKLVCYAKKGQDERILFGDQELGIEPLSELVNLNGKIVYIDSVELDRSGRRVVIDGVPGKTYDWVSHLDVINGKLAYIAREDGKTMVVYDREEGKKYDTVSGLKSIGGKLAYTAGTRDITRVTLAPESSPAYKYFIVLDGEEIGKQYYTASNPVDVGGKLAYGARSDRWSGKDYLIIFDGKELGREYGGRAMGAISVGDRLAYFAEVGDKRVVVLDGVEGKHYDNVNGLTDIGGKLAYRAEDAGKTFIVMES